MIAVAAIIGAENARLGFGVDRILRDAKVAELPVQQPTKYHAHSAFLQNRLLAQVKSSRSINRFRILHGRLIEQAKIIEDSKVSTEKFTTDVQLPAKGA
jgi:hypothetical protein